jgi:prevent-host-death family protein
MNHQHAGPRTMSSREFNQNTSGAKQAATNGPLVITDRGKPSFVLMTHAEFERLQQPRPKRFISVLEALEQKGGPEYDFEIELPERRIEPIRDPFKNDDE